MSKKQGTLFREQLWDQGFCFGVGDGRPLGVFIDWCCLYQDFPPGSRTPLQTKVFQAAMEHIECWYANRHTTVWMLAYPYEPPNELVVTLLRGRNLMVKDNNWFSKGGSSDPLAHISVDCRRRLHQQKFFEQFQIEQAGGLASAWPEWSLGAMRGCVTNGRIAR